MENEEYVVDFDVEFAKSIAFKFKDDEIKEPNFFNKEVVKRVLDNFFQ